MTAAQCLESSEDFIRATCFLKDLHTAGRRLFSVGSQACLGLGQDASEHSALSVF
jgi:hypothetical protein